MAGVQQTRSQRHGRSRAVAAHALILALGRQTQVDLFEFEISLFYRASPGQSRLVTPRNPISKKKKEVQKSKQQE